MNSIITYSLIIIIACMASIILPVYVQYLKHKAPLKAVDPNVKYGFFHHVQIVTIPLIRYRLARKKEVRAQRPTMNNSDSTS